MKHVLRIRVFHFLKMNCFVLELTCFMLCCSMVDGEYSFNQSRDLRLNLLRNYDRMLRPIVNQTEPINVTVLAYIRNIQDIDEVNSKSSVMGFMLVSWTDEVLRWDPDTNHGIPWLMFTVSEIWQPTMVLMNQHGPMKDPVYDWQTIRVAHDGQAMYAPGGVFDSICQADITYYPFDIQNCSISFIAYGYSEKELTLTLLKDNVPDAYYLEHGEWDIVENSTIVGYPFNDTLTLILLIRRKPLYFVIHIIFPIILLSLLNIFAFALPPESGERVSYSVTVLLAIAVFHTLIGDNLPKTSNPTSMLSYFLMINMTLSALMCMFAILSMRIHTIQTAAVLPAWANCIVRITSWRRRPLSRKSKFQNQDDGSIDVFAENGKQNSSNDNGAIKSDIEEETVHPAWVDVSKSVDIICMVAFFVLTTVNTLVYMLIVVPK